MAIYIDGHEHIYAYIYIYIITMYIMEHMIRAKILAFVCLVEH